jgi:hypothetical protein
MKTSVSSLLLLTLLPVVLSAQGVVQLEAFNVSAQKRTQSVADVPVPITVYTGSFLERAGVSDFKSLAPLVPGLFIQSSPPTIPASISAASPPTAATRAPRPASRFSKTASPSAAPARASLSSSTSNASKY